MTEEINKKTLEFLIVLQTHTLSSNDHQKEQLRYCGAKKPEVTKRCVRSLIHSIKYAQERLPWVNFFIKIFDDHSDLASIQTLQTDFAKSGLAYDWEPLESRGIMPSILKCYEFGRDRGKDLVYFVQDDYLYFETCILEMILDFQKFSQIVGAPISIYPYNDPYRYLPHNLVEKVHVFQGCGRHWRTNFHPSSCFMVPHSILLKEWDVFFEMGTSPVYSGMEQATIGRLFIERNYVMFTPIPSLALHMQLETERDPFLDWRPLWEQFADKNHSYTGRNKFSLPDGEILLNVGCGRVKLNMKALRNPMVEVRVDADPSALADVYGTIQDLSVIEDGRVARVYASHVLEHVLWSELLPVMKEFQRVLKPGGMAVVAVPNLASIADRLLDERIVDPIYQSSAGPIGPLDMIYGFRQYTAAGQDGMLHKIGFNKFLLEKLFVEAGWSTVAVVDRGTELVAFGVKASAVQWAGALARQGGLPPDAEDFLNL